MSNENRRAALEAALRERRANNRSKEAETKKESTNDRRVALEAALRKRRANNNRPNGNANAAVFAKDTGNSNRLAAQRSWKPSPRISRDSARRLRYSSSSSSSNAAVVAGRDDSRVTDRSFEIEVVTDKGHGEGRKSPTESASEYPIGHREVGNDGNVWKSIETRNGVRRWQKEGGTSKGGEKKRDKKDKRKPSKKRSK